MQPAVEGSKEKRMYAHRGDRIVVRSHHLGTPNRDGEVVEVKHPDGSPPYRVRWSDDGHESLFFPGPDAYVDHPDAHGTQGTHPVSG